jgi:hypothetical protein
MEADGYAITGARADESLVTTPSDYLNFGFGSDVRLDRTTRAYASFYLNYPNTTTATTNLYNPLVAQTQTQVTSGSQLTFSDLNIKELFLDYSLGDLVIFRIGRQSATWGQGRIFNPGNLVENVANGVAAKASFAAGPVAVTAFAIKNDSEYNVSDTSTEGLGVASVATAALAEYSADWYTVGLSGFYHIDVGEKASAYFKTSLWGTDLFVEGLAERGTEDQKAYTEVAGLYREFGDQQKWLKLQVEYLFSGRGDDGSFATVVNHPFTLNDQTFGLGASTESLSDIQTKPSVLWLHALSDNSGQVSFGLVNSTLPHLDLSLAVNRVYGDPGSRYIVNNADSTGRIWSLTFKASFHFELNN